MKWRIVVKHGKRELGVEKAKSLRAALDRIEDMILELVSGNGHIEIDAGSKTVTLEVEEGKGN